jgi:hypothetical protein
VRFISELGRPGPFEIPSIPTIRRWRLLKDAPQEKFDDFAGIQKFGRRLSRIRSQDSLSIYARVSGILPVDEAIARVNTNSTLSDGLEGKTLPSFLGAAILQGEINVTVAGEVALDVEAPLGTIAWIKSTPFTGDAAKHIVTDLPRGKHPVTLRVPNLTTSVAKLGVRVKVTKSKTSRAQFEPIGGP